jgi:hypothetical protein
VLNRTDDEMALRTRNGAGNAQQREIVGFGGATGEHDLLAARADQCGNLGTRRGNGLRRNAPVRV